MKDKLTKLEFAVFKLLIRGCSIYEIKDELNLSIVETTKYINNIVRKFKARNEMHAIAKGLFYYLDYLPDTQEYLFDFK